MLLGSLCCSTRADLSNGLRLEVRWPTRTRSTDARRLQKPAATPHTRTPIRRLGEPAVSPRAAMPPKPATAWPSLSDPRIHRRSLTSASIATGNDFSLTQSRPIARRSAIDHAAFEMTRRGAGCGSWRVCIDGSAYRRLHVLLRAEGHVLYWKKTQRTIVASSPSRLRGRAWTG